MNRVLNHGIQKVSAGYTLIEVLVVLSLVSSLMGGTIGLMSIVQKSDKTSKQGFSVRQELRRFADDVRRDTHSASDVQTDQTSLTLSRESSTQPIVYRVESTTSVSRVVLNPDESSVTRDEYAIGRDAGIQIELLDNNKLVQWTITESDRPNAPIRIVAARRLAP
ncbi:prepilin-type N-terminal cleavage/methylation domain-containing protein [Aporhodopirellula aestuarii]|uniref:Prepilin-type N-terminal cleavage/methylation domain-containing protein n=1 Tax=Aporhodopirellula aestuarii TaxID=2950107 RepID=A0ABT0U8Q5_9BACT|nr:prepilin-type N-terminal cleavage/methylation domain-containing protein [Aporhodopirellula aestuarii]MCM2373161.1 prepilin-type N-terminal cleavage/methylation domain-containing protein [Aporhodopirellula aestuarii]